MESQAPTIQPIDYLVLAGFQKQFQQVFGCAKCAFINASDKTKVLERLFGRGKPLEYPYAYFEIKKVGDNNTAYNAHNMMRRGMVLNVDSADTVQTVRIIPTDFDIDITYVTNKFQSVDQGSVMAFARRWLLARRAGYLKTSIDYGRMQFGVGITMDSGVSTPSLSNITDSETSFPISVSATIHGYTSEPVLGQQGKVNTFNVNGDIGGVNGKVVSTQFFAFPQNSQEA